MAERRGYDMIRKVRPFLVLGFLLLGSGCSLWHRWDCWSIDGKAASWCNREKRAQEACKKHGGMKDYYYGWAECNDEFKDTGID